MNPIPQPSDRDGASSSSNGGGSSSSAGGSAAPVAEKPKATDISHLIKRKKPDTPNEVNDVPPKKANVE